MTIDIKATPVFEKNWLTTKKIVVNRGGTRSSKTYSICQILIIWLFTGEIRKGQFIMEGKATIVRKFKSTISSTVEEDILSILEDANLYGLVDHNKTKKAISYEGRKIAFLGADDSQKLRGYGGEILYCNEANELGFKNEFFQLLVRTTELVFIDLNPSDPYVWINEEIEQTRAKERGDVDVIVSTYKDNPFLSDEHIKEIEYIENVDSQLWDVYGLGQYGKVEGLIYPDFTIVDKMPENLSKRGYGLDFGFTVDPLAFLECGVQNRTDLYIDELVYETDLTNFELNSYFKEIGVSRTLPIYYDSAEPKSGKELRNMGWNMIGADKGPDSILFGIKTVKRFNLFVTARSVNVIKELRKYKNKQLKDGTYINRPIDMFNHGMDAKRYYAMMELGDHQSSLPRML